MALLDVTGLDAGYGDLQILEDVSLTVDDGEYVTIVGPNGAGKSTAMKTIFGLTTYMGGSITFDGEEISDRRPEDIIRMGIGYVPQSDNVFASLSVKENLEMGAYILDEVPQNRLELVYDRFPILAERKGQKAGTMSGGQQQMLAIGRALVGDPDLLLVDEPSEGVQPSIVQSITEDLRRINEEFGTTILFVEQNLSVIQGLSQRCYAIDRGTIVDEVVGDAVRDRERLEEYLVV